jgi:hypothetical protein
MAQEDPEIKAMGTVAGALSNLDSDAQTRVLHWAFTRFNITPPSGRGSGAGSRGGGTPGVEINGNGHEGAEFQAFVDLFDAARPRTDAERALIGGYWFQVVGGSTDFQAQQVNTALKDVGHGVENITNALSSLQERSPALVRQVAKSGRTRQARKKYKLTTAGAAAVRRMLAGQDGGEEDS